MLLRMTVCRAGQGLVGMQMNMQSTLLSALWCLLAAGEPWLTLCCRMQPCSSMHATATSSQAALEACCTDSLTAVACI